MFTAGKLLLAALSVGGAVLFIYLIRRAAYRQLEGRDKTSARRTESRAH